MLLDCLEVCSNQHGPQLSKAASARSPYSLILQARQDEESVDGPDPPQGARQIERGAAATSREAHVACESEREDWYSQRQCCPEAVRWSAPSVWALGVQQATIPACRMS